MKARRLSFVLGISVSAAIVSAAFGLTTAWAVYQIPNDRVVKWEGNVGVPGDIPNRTTVCAALSPSGADDAPTIQKEITACAGGVVKLSNGTFLIGSTIRMKSGVVLRGDGMGVTHLKGMPGMTGNSFISFGGGVGMESSFNLVMNGPVKGSSSITTSIPHNWKAGDIILVDQIDDEAANPPVVNRGYKPDPCTWCARRYSNPPRSMGQYVRISAVPSSTTATLEIPLYWNFDPARAPQGTRFSSWISDAGVESLTVDNLLSGSSLQSESGTILMQATATSWLNQVEVIGSYRQVVRFYHAYRNTIRGCRFHEGVPPTPANGAQYDTSRAYAIDLLPGSANLIENNEMYHLTMMMIFVGQSSGNVVAYNYFHDGYNGGSIDGWQQEAVNNHGAHPMMNLIEGNLAVGLGMGADDVWGTSSHSTLFRNRLTNDGSQTGARWAVPLYKGNWYFNLLGNVLGDSGDPLYEMSVTSYRSDQRAIFKLGYSGTGVYDPQVKGTLLRHQNWDGVHGQTILNDNVNSALNSSDAALPASLYLASKPAWFKAAQWPAIGPDITPMFPAAPPLGTGTPWDQVSSVGNASISASAGTGGAIAPSGVVTVSPGGSKTFSIASTQGYTIADVKVDGNSIGPVSSYTFSNVLTNHTIEASFAAVPVVTYSITAKAYANGSISPSGTTSIPSGGSLTYTITPAPGYLVSAVVVDGASTAHVTSYTFSNVTANHTIAVSFKPVPVTSFSITATAYANGSISPSGTSTVQSGGSQTYTIMPARRYRVSAVVVDGISVGPVTSYTFSNVTANHTIAVSFRRK